jgi:S-adenosylmethionine-diacylgycerolhomoserine-N-methlytransferase
VAILSDLKILATMARGQRRKGSHREALEDFYAVQSTAYDRFREKLLHGRSELVAQLHVPDGGTLVELGGGTGRNLEWFGERLRRFGQVRLVDLCPSLLEQARARCARQGWTNVECIDGDATAWQPPAPVDCVMISYAVTMIPDWRGALDNAVAMLKPGGTLGIVDFYVSAAEVAPGRVRHGALTRWLWPRWFGHDGVHPNPAHLAHLESVTELRALQERRGKVPYLLGATAPYYVYVGAKKAS